LNSNYRFAFYLVEPVGLQDALKYGVKAEEWGFDVVAACENLFWWIPEHPPVWDNFTVLTTVMNRTKNIKLLTNVIDPVKRHPAIVAHIATTLDNIAKGRIAIGIGAGEVANFGSLVDMSGPKPYRLFTRTKEFIKVMQGVWSSTIDKPYNFNGTHFKVKDAFLTLKPLTKPHPSIYLAAMGPKMLKLTADMADGWTPCFYTPEAYEKDWKKIKIATEDAGRNINEIDPSLTIYTIVLRNSDRAKDLALMKGKTALAARPRLLRNLGYSDLAEKFKYMAIWKRSGPMGVETTREKELVKMIPEEAATNVIISGNSDDAIEQIENFTKAGVKLFILWPPYEEKDVLKETIENYRDKILPYFAENKEQI